MITYDDEPITIQERFEAFHAANPWVFRELRRLTHNYLAAGHQRIGIGMLFEVLRWERNVTHGDEFKLNNNFRSRYVRMLIEDQPHWVDAFETRRLRAS